MSESGSPPLSSFRTAWWVLVLSLCGGGLITFLTWHETRTHSSLPDSIIPAASENFFLHVNQKWQSDPANAIPAEYTSWGTFTKLHDDSLQNQIALLQELSAKNPSELNDEERKLAMVWNISMKTFARWENETEEEAKQIGYYRPITNDLATLDRLLPSEAPADEDYPLALAKTFAWLEEIQISFPFRVGATSDMTRTDDVIMYLTAGGLSLSHHYYIKENFKDKLEQFKEHLQEVETLLRDCGVNNLEANFAELTHSFECDLAHIRMNSSQSRLRDKYFTNTAFDQFAKDIDQLHALEEKKENYSDDEKEVSPYSDAEKDVLQAFFDRFLEEIKFPSVMEANFEKSYPSDNERVDRNSHRMCVFDGDYFRRVFRLLFDSSRRHQLRAYLQYRIIQDAKSTCTKALNEIFFDFFNRTLFGQKEQKTPTKRAILRINNTLGELLGKIYVERFFSIQSKENVNEMIDTVLDVMKDSLTQNDWLTEPTKAKALEKLALFTKKIGFPDHWKDYSALQFDENDDLYDVLVKISNFYFKRDTLDKLNTPKDRTEWYIDPQVVNAYFAPSNNEIVFPAAILQPPFFMANLEKVDFEHSSLPESCDPELFRLAVNFGGIGCVIAHEITHGFDDQGRKYDGHGNLVDWWTPEDAELFKQKSTLLEEQVATYEFVEQLEPDAEGEVKSKVHQMDAALTMGENIADLGGVSLAKQALLRYLKDQPEEVVQICLEGFFKAWATCWRINMSQSLRASRLSSDPHGPADFRGNLVRNFEEFHRVFRVAETDPMFLASEKRLVMW